MDIPSGTKREDWVRGIGRRGYSALWSEAAVYIPDPKISDDQIEAIRNNEGHVTATFRALRSFNQFVCAYAIGTSQLFGGASLRMLTDAEFLDCLHTEITFLSPPAYEITDHDVEEVFAWEPDRGFRSLGQLTGELHDLPADILNALDDVLQEVRKHAFHEIAFKAKTEMIGSEPIVGVVLACAALEGVLAEFLRRHTKEVLNDKLVNDLLREQGISTLIQVVPRLMISDEELPSDQLFTRCARAITVRNDIIHAKSSKGKYKLRNYTSKELDDAFSALIEMYDHLLKGCSGHQLPS